MTKIILLISYLTFSVQSFSQKRTTLSELSVVKFSCGGVDTMILNIYMEESIISAKFSNHGSNMGLIPRTSILTSSQYALYEKFVKELKRLKQTQGCTSLYFYKLEEKGKVIEKVDGGCKWFGIDKLIREIFGD